MTIELPETIERELRDLARIQSRDVIEIVEEAVRQYLEASATGAGDDPEGRLARLERQGLLRRASAPLPCEVLMANPPQDDGASVLEALLTDRREG